ncbi:hypothetical protein [Rhizobium lusitanum]|jgi:hypothetical protein|uniref:Cold-shock protein n=1 Tax=Rhizobium lusitanum TaxID=293958 RepID=A0A1C3V3U3_9HYPH|nr:hypothetical protein [Rhizobium lusitanum]NKJ04592.1 hypothetical protein [Rhizobium sp. SG741]NKJ37679.1 hypothetical protein [Rhizobium sp. SG570]NRP87966.1 hypothetical protein [Ensifer adhaerens]NTJ10186.1 cold-shock protein [Rhizobium lusitanum]SCB22450.1 hypothetical protein GA0061101_104175 [Rhizobium lusitanum]
MSRMKFSAGDVVVLKADLTRLKAAPRTCRIISMLPSDSAEAYYQVRFTHESFERRISEADIEQLCADPVADSQNSTSARPEPWLKPLTAGGKKQAFR